jgi:hypothetical protein
MRLKPIEDDQHKTAMLSIGKARLNRARIANVLDRS